MSNPTILRSSGGLIAPQYLPDLPKPGDLFYVTYQVKWPWRRWRLRRNGWSTEWTCEYEHQPLHALLPKFTAVRGGITIQ